LTERTLLYEHSFGGYQEFIVHSTHQHDN